MSGVHWACVVARQVTPREERVFEGGLGVDTIDCDSEARGSEAYIVSLLDVKRLATLGVALIRAGVAFIPL